jgi:hypothetical protein
VQVGRTPPRWRGRFGRLRLNISLLPARRAPAGLAKIYALQSRAMKAAFVLAGPVAHATAGTIILFGGIAANIEIVTAIGVVIILTALLNLVPFEQHGFHSDGARLLALVKTRHSEPIRALDGSSVAPWLRSLQETQARWLALVTDDKNLKRNHGLGNALGWTPVAVGFARDDRGPLAVALTRLALAGWCWREAERAELAPILPGLQEAWETAIAAYPGEIFPTPVAAKAAVDTVELGLASPGATETERKGFLTRGFADLPEALRPAEIPRGQQWYAFRFGVAIHDVEAAKPEAEAQRKARSAPA